MKASFWVPLAAISPDVYTRITISAVAKLIAHLRSTADSLINWCVLSSKVIDEAIKKSWIVQYTPRGLNYPRGS